MVSTKVGNVACNVQTNSNKQLAQNNNYNKLIKRHLGRNDTYCPYLSNNHTLALTATLPQHFVLQEHPSPIKD